ncbi:methylmalonyl Co-A mutase-associated GTPase MeaB [Pseudozobellia thermophila]|uniref:Methylmalonyl-CoA mutase metallochaperone MeaB n=1 Tax=Pseudozobellia thermophila TaxID=192903 RepID=A0A1M6HZ04_9FLAO|nr:methylmalonyl Co-A mutase-associated GTPase MeaB [Pseudozobellia thermophila]SHJ27391.1 methylmalonyl-CoA mutase metallochaperone MeaB [Pseudozobellia thermophila]
MDIEKHTDPANISKIRRGRKTEHSIDDLLKGIFNGDKTMLAKAITLIESTRKDDFEKANIVLEECLQRKTDSMRIGITGVPGVGKSTFIETLGKLLAQKGNKVAVLAIDPTSSRNKGSILGDKTRMQGLVKEANAFVRPSPSSKSLGGVARKTRESIILCEAAGYNVILVETVGVGQSEVAVHGMVDFFLLLKIPGAGDELQGIKRGIIEMADAIAINKADGNNLENAKAAATEFKRALALYPPKENDWKPKVLICSAFDDNSVLSVWKTIESYIGEARRTSYFSQKRKEQNKNWLYESIEGLLKTAFFNNQKVVEKMDFYTEKVINQEITPYRAAEKLIALSKNT